MTESNVIQFRPRPNPNRLTSQELEMAAIALTEAMARDPIRGLFLTEGYHAPDEDSA